MSKELTPLQALENIFDFIKSECVEDEYQEDIDIIEKSLKALEIIKEKEVLSVYKDFKGTCYLFVNTMGIEITEEEYDLLKEVVLCN